MSARSVIRYEQWTLSPDREPDAEPVTFSMECAVCGQRSHASVDFGDVQDWTLRHAGRRPTHHTYREIVQRPWRAWRG
ncbi:MAG: hypothetical protein ACRDP3_04560 [Streptomyces sp.]|uniref:DUF7848 domain-containing protein n=1 Tax=Streptomyces sp. TaxID=1931 RepID=UPI003D6BC86F